jgi:hypothetical protein
MPQYSRYPWAKKRLENANRCSAIAFGGAAPFAIPQDLRAFRKGDRHLKRIPFGAFLARLTCVTK